MIPEICQWQAFLFHSSKLLVTWTKRKAVAMEGVAKQKEKEVKSTKRAYSAALRIDTADT
jgi:hypothetical protein